MLDVESFELELRTSDGKDPKFPKMDLRLRTNKINMRTCTDSCKALFELIRYFANDGDLVEYEEEPTNKRQSLDLEMMNKEEVCYGWTVSHCSVRLARQNNQGERDIICDCSEFNILPK